MHQKKGIKNQVREFLQSQRQRSFPVEFRINRVQWPSGEMELLEHLIRSLGITNSELGGGSDPDGPHPHKDDDRTDHIRLVKDIGTGLWRARKNMIEENSDRPKEGLEKSYRHIQSIFDALESLGVRIKDHTGEPWSDGRAIRALAFQEMPNLTGEMIIETIRPSIFFRDEHIQMSQVIVGIPAGCADDHGR